MDPRDGGILALANWPRVNANEPGDAPGLRAPEPRDRRHLRAGLDLQGVHGRGRARAEGGHARHRVQPRADDHGRRPRDRRVAPARLRHAQHAPDPRAVLQRRRDHDRPAARLQGLRQVGAPLRLRPADRDRPAGRGAGHRAPARALLRLLDGQPADRPGHRGHADADGDRLLRDRQRRDPAPGAHDRVRRRPRGAQAGGPPGDLRGDRVVAAADARGRARPGRHRLRRGDPRLPAGRQDRHGGEARPGHRRLLREQVRVLVRRLRSGQDSRSCSSR